MFQKKSGASSESNLQVKTKEVPRMTEKGGLRSQVIQEKEAACTIHIMSPRLGMLCQLLPSTRENSDKTLSSSVSISEDGNTRTTQGLSQREGPGLVPNTFDPKLVSCLSQSREPLRQERELSKFLKPCPVLVLSRLVLSKTWSLMWRCVEPTPRDEAHFVIGPRLLVHFAYHRHTYK